MEWIKSKIETVIQLINDNNFKSTLLDTSVPGVYRPFLIGFNNNDPLPGDDDNNPVPDLNLVEKDSHRKYVLLRVGIKDYNVLINGRNFYDQNISDDFKKYD